MCDCDCLSSPPALCELHQGQVDRAVAMALADREARAIVAAIDATHMVSVIVARLTGVPTAEIPRLLVSAACRSVEKLAEFDQERLSETHRAQLAGMVEHTAKDLRRALAEGLASLEPQPPQTTH